MSVTQSFAMQRHGWQAGLPDGGHFHFSRAREDAVIQIVDAPEGCFALPRTRTKDDNFVGKFWMMSVVRKSRRKSEIIRKYQTCSE
jgi:hypothetical protein